MSKRWSKEDDQYLKEHYASIPAEDIGEHLGRSKQSVMVRASRLEIPSGRFLTKEQRAFVEKNSHMDNKRLAKILGRSSDSVKTIRYNMALPSVKEGGGDCLCLSEIARLVGEDKGTIRVCWAKYGLKIKKSSKYKIVKQKDLFRFMKEHPERWDATRCERWYFQEFKWFEDKRKEDFQKMIDRRWSNAEKKIL